MQRKRPGAELIVSDWRPLRSSNKYKDGHDQVNWDGGKLPSKGKEIPIHVGCGGECDALPYEGDEFDTQLYECRKCGAAIYEEPGRIEWKRLPE